jgi:hypothetical protein
MHTMHTTPVTELPGGQVLRVTDGRGHGIAVFEGVVWITQADDERDVFLLPGETFHFDRDGIAVVEALSDARVAVYREPHRPLLRGAAVTVAAAALALGSGLYMALGGDRPRAPELLAALDLSR